MLNTKNMEERNTIKCEQCVWWQETMWSDFFSLTIEIKQNILKSGIIQHSV